MTNVTNEPCSRCVNGIPANAGAAIAEVTPGTTSNAIPAATSACGLFAAAAEDEWVAAFEPHDAPSRARVFDQDAIDFGLFDAAFLAALFAGEDALGPGRRQPQNFGTDECVVNDYVGASRITAAPRSVIRSGAPGPAPTRKTLPPESLTVHLPGFAAPRGGFTVKSSCAFDQFASAALDHPLAQRRADCGRGARHFGKVRPDR